ncbi:MAG: hypothetical protein NWR72_10340 [Bacteroidia bacterium]|nr:hypothetical protein [Bacteroidia bacterium]
MISTIKTLRPFFFLLPLGLLMGASTAPAPVATPPAYCELYGAVYVEQQAAFANYRVFLQENEAFADLIVFREDGEAFADRPGFWYITDVKAFADFTIAFETNEGMANFSIAYTDFRSAAGCQK